jgi:hypothetical protein
VTTKRIDGVVYNLGNTVLEKQTETNNKLEAMNHEFTQASPANDVGKNILNIICACFSIPAEFIRSALVSALAKIFGSNNNNQIVDEIEEKKLDKNAIAEDLERLRRYPDSHIPLTARLNQIEGVFKKFKAENLLTEQDLTSYYEWKSGEDKELYISELKEIVSKISAKIEESLFQI